MAITYHVGGRVFDNIEEAKYYEKTIELREALVELIAEVLPEAPTRDLCRKIEIDPMFAARLRALMNGLV
jgi:hypothetical protein